MSVVRPMKWKGRSKRVLSWALELLTVGDSAEQATDPEISVHHPIPSHRIHDRPSLLPSWSDDDDDVGGRGGEKLPFRLFLSRHAKTLSLSLSLLQFYSVSKGARDSSRKTTDRAKVGAELQFCLWWKWEQMRFGHNFGRAKKHRHYLGNNLISYRIFFSLWSRFGGETIVDRGGGGGNKGRVDRQSSLRRTRTRDDYLQITPRAKHHPTTRRRRSGRRLETYREIIMMSPVLPPKGWDQKEK